MHESDLGVFADAIAEIAVEAGKAILEIYEQDFEVTQKDDASPLTQADLASHRIICDALAELTQSQESLAKAKDSDLSPKALKIKRDIQKSTDTAAALEA